MKIAVILPSRGLMFSETAEEILTNLKPYEHKIFFAHRKPIPECFESPTEAALADSSVTHLWFVEDDMKLPSDALKRLVEADKAVATIDYPINKAGRGSVFKVDKQVIFCGTGCLLVKRAVFDELKKPYFRTDIKWNIKNYGEFLKMKAVPDASLDGYGLHDVNFCMNLHRLNIPIHKLPGKLGQRKLIALGKAGSNNGQHIVEEWTKVVEGHLLEQIKKWPVEPLGALTTVMTPTGEIMVSESHAKTLIDKGLATAIPKRKLVIEWGDL